MRVKQNFSKQKNIVRINLSIPAIPKNVKGSSLGQKEIHKRWKCKGIKFPNRK